MYIHRYTCTCTIQYEQYGTLCVRFIHLDAQRERIVFSGWLRWSLIGKTFHEVTRGSLASYIIEVYKAVAGRCLHEIELDSLVSVHPDLGDQAGRYHHDTDSLAHRLRAPDFPFPFIYSCDVTPCRGNYSGSRRDGRSGTTLEHWCKTGTRPCRAHGHSILSPHLGSIRCVSRLC